MRGERVTPLLDGNRQKLYLSPKHRLTAGMAEVCADSVLASKGQLRTSGLPLEL